MINIKNIELETINEIINKSLDQFYMNDKDLFDLYNEEMDNSERCMVFHIGGYMKNLIKSNYKMKMLDVDVEYTRNIDKVKEIKINDVSRRIIPDLIIHERKSNNNLAAFEFKKKGQYLKSSSDNDIDKLSYLTNLNNEYKYKYGFLIVLSKSLKSEIHVFENENK